MSKLEFLVSGNEVGTSVRFHPCRRRQLELRRRSSSSRRSVSTRPAVSINCTSFFFKKKWAIPGLSLVYFHLFKQTLQFLQHTYVKNVYPVYGAGIRTHNLQGMSLLQQPLGQGSHPYFTSLKPR